MNTAEAFICFRFFYLRTGLRNGNEKQTLEFLSAGYCVSISDSNTEWVRSLRPM